MRSAHPFRKVSPAATSLRMLAVSASSPLSVARIAAHAGEPASAAGRGITLRAEAAPNLNSVKVSDADLASDSCDVGCRNMSTVANARVAASAAGVPCSAASVHHTNVAPRASHRRLTARERQMWLGSGAKSTGAANSFSPVAYCPIMKATWKALTSAAQRVRMYPMIVARAAGGTSSPTMVKPLVCASTRGWPITQMKRSTAAPSVALRMSTWFSIGGSKAGGASSMWGLLLGASSTRWLLMNPCCGREATPPGVGESSSEES